MRDYGTVSPLFWRAGSGKRLRGRPLAQLVGMYLLTCQASNTIGLFYLPIPTLCHETGLSEPEARLALAQCAEARFSHYDEEHELVWIPNAAEIRIGETLHSNDKRRKGIQSELAAHGKHRFVRQFVARYGGPYGLQQGEISAEGSPSKGFQQVDEASYSISYSNLIVSDPVSEIPPPTGSPPEQIPPEADSGTMQVAEPSRDAKYMAAYVRGIEGGKRGPYVPPGTLADQGRLNVALAKFGRDGDGKALRGEALLGWIEDAASDFATDVTRLSQEDPRQVEFFSGFAAKGFVRWLNVQEMSKEARRVG